MLMGYGVSITTDKSLLCIGGADANQHFSDVFLLEWIEGKIKRTSLPALPQACIDSRPIADLVTAPLWAAPNRVGQGVSETSADAGEFFTPWLNSPNLFSLLPAIGT
jgi:hypothetical protein